MGRRNCSPRPLGLLIPGQHWFCSRQVGPLTCLQSPNPDPTLLSPSDVFQKYQSLTGGIPDQATGLLKITPAQYKNLKPLVFNVGGKAYPLNANAQIFPRTLNTLIGGDANGIYLIVSDLGTPSGQGLDFIDGYSFLQRYYSVYDSTPGKMRVGLARTLVSLWILWFGCFPHWFFTCSSRMPIPTNRFR